VVVIEIFQALPNRLKNLTVVFDRVHFIALAKSLIAESRLKDQDDLVPLYSVADEYIFMAAEELYDIDLGVELLLDLALQGVFGRFAKFDTAAGRPIIIVFLDLVKPLADENLIAAPEDTDGKGSDNARSRYKILLKRKLSDSLEVAFYMSSHFNFFTLFSIFFFIFSYFGGGPKPTALPSM